MSRGVHIYGQHSEHSYFHHVPVTKVDNADHWRLFDQTTYNSIGGLHFQCIMALVAHFLAHEKSCDKSTIAKDAADNYIVATWQFSSR